MATKENDKILYRLTSILTKLSNGEQPTMAELSPQSFKDRIKTGLQEIIN